MRRLATRLGRVSPSATLALKAEAERLQREGRDIIDLGPGEPDFATPPSACAAGVAAIESGFTHYTNPAGIDELRQAIAGHYTARSGQPIAASEVLVGPGGKSMLFAAVLALINPGDEVAIFSPYWVSFPDQVRLAGGVPIFAPTCAEDGFSLRAAQLAAVLTPATRAVVVNSPCNPSGGILARDEAAALVRLVVERDLWLIADETYELFLYDERDRLSLLEFRATLAERLILISSFSKTYAMTGWRVGFSIAAPEITRAMLTVQSHDTTQAASMAQKAAAAALERATAAPAAMLAVYRARRERVMTALARMPGVSCVAPRGAFYAFPDVRELMQRRGVDSSAELARQLLAEEGVSTIPGEAFGAPGHLRLSYATADARLDEGLARLARFALRSAGRVGV